MTYFVPPLSTPRWATQPTPHTELDMLLAKVSQGHEMYVEAANDRSVLGIRHSLTYLKGTVTDSLKHLKADEKDPRWFAASPDSNSANIDLDETIGSIHNLPFRTSPNDIKFIVDNLFMALAALNRLDPPSKTLMQRVVSKIGDAALGLVPARIATTSAALGSLLNIKKVWKFVKPPRQSQQERFPAPQPGLAPLLARVCKGYDMYTEPQKKWGRQYSLTYLRGNTTDALKRLKANEKDPRWSAASPNFNRANSDLKETTDRLLKFPFRGSPNERDIKFLVDSLFTVLAALNRLDPPSKTLTQRVVSKIGNAVAKCRLPGLGLSVIAGAGAYSGLVPAPIAITSITLGLLPNIKRVGQFVKPLATGTAKAVSYLPKYPRVSATLAAATAIGAGLVPAPSATLIATATIGSGQVPTPNETLTAGATIALALVTTAIAGGIIGPKRMFSGIKTVASGTATGVGIAAKQGWSATKTVASGTATGVSIVAKQGWSATKTVASGTATGVGIAAKQGWSATKTVASGTATGVSIAAEKSLPAAQVIASGTATVGKKSLAATQAIASKTATNAGVAVKSAAKMASPVLASVGHFARKHRIIAITAGSVPIGATAAGLGLITPPLAILATAATGTGALIGKAIEKLFLNR